MSARTCLHCGKTLVFIRVGAGGDFCSREHRNQHRLRRGMDCLAEANKVSTLARRRENPKTLFGAPSAGGIEPRGFPDAAPFGLLAGLNPGLRRTRKSGLASWLRPAQPLDAAAPGIAAGSGQRELGVKFAASAQAVLRKASPSRRKLSGLATKRKRGLRPVAAPPAPGNALRVSSSVGFRLKARLPRRIVQAAFQVAPTMRGGLADIRARAARQQPLGTAADARLAFVEMGFSAALEAQARLDWFRGGPEGKDS